ncbi:MAG: hypothetical protein K0S33_1949 [Bacteroidetes bacterium]|jgi:hypothetical protein|nr:hypothetical protein [Bacteroidota bacterium]
MRAVVFIVSVLLLFSCSKEELEKKEYMDWYATHTEEMSREQSFGSLTFKTTYLPAELVATRNCSDCKANGLKEAIAGQQQYLQFRLRIASENNPDVLKEQAHDEAEYNAQRDYYENGLADDVFVVSGKDTLTCLMHHMERNYNALPYAEILFAFEPGDRKSDCYLVLNDKVFGKGYIKFYFPKEIFEKGPTLKI